MSAIKDFFKKKKADAKFKLAGTGHKLTDSSGAPRASGSAPRDPRMQERAHPSQSSQQAGAAALNRMASKEQKEVDLVKARQRAMIKDKARQELEREQQIDAEIAKIKSVYGDKEDIEVEGPQHLAVSGVFFKCDLIGGESGPRDVIKRKIREFLYNQLEDERCLTAVLIIHTCNSPRDRVELCVETLSKYIDNIVNNPAEIKYRKIRKNNKAFNERVASLEGTAEFLEGCGFRVTQMEGPDGKSLEDFWHFPEDNTDFESLAAMRDTLKSAEPVAAELDRCLTVLPPSQKISRELPADFFNLTKEELKAEQDSKRDQIERESMLRTKAMRDKEEARAKRKYKYCLIRIRFPDGFILQGTFSVYETLSSVMEFVTDCLESPLPYLLVDSASGARISQEDTDQTLVDLGLVPASLLNFMWDPEIERDLASQGGNQLGFLKPELKQ